MNRPWSPLLGSWTRKSESFLEKRLTLSHPQDFSSIFCLFGASLVAYAGSQARSLIRATAASLHHSHSHARSEPHLQTTPQLMAMRDP